MRNKRKRLELVAEILKTNVIGSQEELLRFLVANRYIVTQATLSRDLKQLKVAKTPLSNGTYKYILPPVNQYVEVEGETNHFSSGAILSLDFSGNLAVVKTKPGYASAIAWYIDKEAKREVLGTIAGDDTILLVLREEVPRGAIVEMLHLTFDEC